MCVCVCLFSVWPHYYTDASKRCMVASHRCTIFFQRILYLKAVMNKGSLNALGHTLSFIQPWSRVQSILQSIPQPISLM